jgi:hypothetical protein
LIEAAIAYITPEETSGERDDPGKLGDDFDREKEWRVRHMLDSPADTVCGNSGDLDHDKGECRHCERHVEIGCWGTEDRYVSCVHFLFSMGFIGYSFTGNSMGFIFALFMRRLFVCRFFGRYFFMRRFFTLDVDAANAWE